MRTNLVVASVVAALTVAVAAPGCSGCHGQVRVVATEPAPTPTPTPTQPPPPPPPAMVGAQLDIKGEIEFDVNEATIKDGPGSQQVLNAALQALQSAPQITKLRIEGHTDSDGTPAKNLTLSEKRANAVIAWLTGKGIDPKRLKAVGCAAKDPLVPNTSADNKQKNRRTEFDVEELDGKQPPGYTAACAPNPLTHH